MRLCCQHYAGTSLGNSRCKADSSSYTQVLVYNYWYAMQPFMSQVTDLQSGEVDSQLIIAVCLAEAKAHPNMCTVVTQA